LIVAIATDNKMVAQHFGRCPEYTIYKVDNRSIAEEKVVSNPGHEPGFLPGYLASMGVKCIIAGGMGQRAQSLFASEGIETYVGISGPVEGVIETYLSGELRPGISSCEHPHRNNDCSS